MTLEKSMYPARGAPGRFGLRSGQMCLKKETAIRNASWYNAAGEKLGWGDLSTGDLKRVAAGLKRGEIFIVLDQRTSYFAFLYPKQYAWAKPNGRPNAPGRAYVARHARFVIRAGRVCEIDRHGDCPAAAYVWNEVRIERMTEPELKKLLDLRS